MNGMAGIHLTASGAQQHQKQGKFDHLEGQRGSNLLEEHRVTRTWVARIAM